MTSPGNLGKRILLADDELSVRTSLRMALKLDGHTVAEAENGREALERFAQEPFDLVITDYCMPEMQGDELALNIRQLAPRQRIIMITAHAAELEGSRSPVNAVLSKPFPYETLRRAMTEVLA